MLYYLDTVVVIYAVEGIPANQQRAINHLAILQQAGHHFAISDLTRTECLIPLFGSGNAQRLSDFFRFFHSSNLRTLALTPAMHLRAQQSVAAILTRQFHPLSQSVTDWPTPSIWQPQSNRAAMSF